MARVRSCETRAAVISIAIIFGLLGKVAMANDSVTELRQLVRGLPNELQGWSKSAECEIYSAQNLYDYIDGAAEQSEKYTFSPDFLDNFPG